MNDIAFPLDISNEDDETFRKTLNSCIGTKFVSRWGNLVTDLAIKAVKVIMEGGSTSKLALDIKRYAKVEKVRMKNCGKLKNFK
jgi:T-complex protein 1 subunit gamma